MNKKKLILLITFIAAVIVSIVLIIVFTTNKKDNNTKDTQTVTYSVNASTNIPNSGTISGTGTYDEGSEVILTITLNDGFEFDGWYSNDNKVSSSISYSFIIDKDYNFIAQVNLATPIEYLIQFNSNGGNSINNQTIVKGGKVTEPITPSKEGYKFSGWYNNDSNWNFNDNIVTDNLTLEAHWEVETYTITYQGTLDSTNPNPIEYTIESETITLTNLTKEGYTFLGWTDDEITTPTLTYVISSGSHENKVITANYEINTYTITYELDGGTNNINNPTSYTYETNEITLSDPTKVGYEFIGWTTEGVTTPTKNLTIEKNSTGNKEFTAHFEANTYTITYVDSYNQANSNVTEYTILTDTFSIVDLDDVPGYAFAGWYNDSNERVTEIAKGSYGNLELTAQYELIEYTILFYECENTSDETFKYGDSNISINDGIRSGYTFDGWYLFNEDSVIVTEISEDFIALNNSLILSNNQNHDYAKLEIHLYARWTLAVTNITISGQKTSFKTYDTFSFGGTVTAHYGDNSTNNVTSQATVSGYDMSTAGSQTVTVSYTENSVTKTATYQITVSKAWRTVFNDSSGHEIFSGSVDSRGDAHAYSRTKPCNISTHTEKLRISYAVCLIQFTENGSPYGSVKVIWGNGGTNPVERTINDARISDKRTVTFDYTQGHDIVYCQFSVNGGSFAGSWYQNGIWSGNTKNGNTSFYGYSGGMDIYKVEEYY
jgi:uncharacterized repeat protein (TIGR02543 family)